MAGEEQVEGESQQRQVCRLLCPSQAAVLPGVARPHRVINGPLPAANAQGHVVLDASPQVRTVDQQGGFPWPGSRPHGQTSEAQNNESSCVGLVEGGGAEQQVGEKIGGVDVHGDEHGREVSEMEESFVDMYMHLSKCARSIAPVPPPSHLRALGPWTLSPALPPCFLLKPCFFPHPCA